MRGLFLMLGFFSRLPVGRLGAYDETVYKKSLFWFPISGLVVGAVTALPLMALTYTFPDFLARHTEFMGLLTVALYVAITGGIHLDGLSDSCDGLMSGRSKERILDIMKDSRIGAFGVIGLILYFLFMYVAVAHLSNWKWVLLMPFVGKTMGYATAGFSVYARPERGMGAVFIESISRWHGLMYLGLALLATVGVLGARGGIAYGAAVASMALVQVWSYGSIQGQTGDTVGLTIEVAQAVFLSAGALL